MTKSSWKIDYTRISHQKFLTLFNKLVYLILKHQFNLFLEGLNITFYYVNYSCNYSKNSSQNSQEVQIYSTHFNENILNVRPSKIPNVKKRVLKFDILIIPFRFENLRRARVRIFLINVLWYLMYHIGLQIGQSLN